MKMLGFLLLTVSAVAVPAAAQTVRTATAPWDEFPQLKVSEADIDYDRLSQWAEQALATPECRKAGLRPEKFDIDARYAVQFDRTGGVRNVVIKDMGCAGLNTMVASTVHDWAQKGKLRVRHPDSASWYAGRIAFAGSQRRP